MWQFYGFACNHLGVDALQIIQQDTPGDSIYQQMMNDNQKTTILLSPGIKPDCSYQWTCAYIKYCMGMLHLLLNCLFLFDFRLPAQVKMAKRYLLMRLLRRDMLGPDTILFTETCA